MTHAQIVLHGDRRVDPQPTAIEQAGISGGKELLLPVASTQHGHSTEGKVRRAVGHKTFHHLAVGLTDNDGNRKLLLLESLEDQRKSVSFDVIGHRNSESPVTFLRNETGVPSYDGGELA